MHRGSQSPSTIGAPSRQKFPNIRSGALAAFFSIQPKAVVGKCRSEIRGSQGSLESVSDCVLDQVVSDSND